MKADKVKTMPAQRRKISFPADSVLSAVIQDGDISELTKILQLKRGQVNVNQTNHIGLTALHHAVLSNNLDVVKMLLLSGSNVNAQDVHGYTPLHIAAACNYLQVASLLLVFGADVFASTEQLDTPVDVTTDIGIIRLLTSEMYRIIQENIYWRCYFKFKFLLIWNTLRKFIMLIFSAMCLLFSYFMYVSGLRSAGAGRRGKGGVCDKKNNSTSKHSMTTNNNKIIKPEKQEKLQ